MDILLFDISDITLVKIRYSWIHIQLRLMDILVDINGGFMLIQWWLKGGLMGV